MTSLADSLLTSSTTEAPTCNLYGLSATRDEISGYFAAQSDARHPLAVEKDYVAAPAPGKPGNPGYVVRSGDGIRVLDVMRWGFPRPDGKAVVNVRNYDSPFWRGTLRNPDRRCLVPFTRFQEWGATHDPETSKKRPYWFSLPSSPIAAFAGIWRPTEAEPVYAFLTCGYDGDPNLHPVGRIHPKACPVILHPEDYDRWLGAPLEDALELASAFPSQLVNSAL